MALAFLCARCDRCETVVAAHQAERVNDRPHCRPCARAARTETCPTCGHLMLGIHGVFGCLFELSDTEFCPCPPPALDALPLMTTRSR